MSGEFKGGPSIGVCPLHGYWAEPSDCKDGKCDKRMVLREEICVDRFDRMTGVVTTTSNPVRAWAPGMQVKLGDLVAPSLVKTLSKKARRRR